MDTKRLSRFRNGGNAAMEQHISIIDQQTIRALKGQIARREEALSIERGELAEERRMTNRQAAEIRDLQETVKELRRKLAKDSVRVGFAESSEEALREAQAEAAKLTNLVASYRKVVKNLQASRTEVRKILGARTGERTAAAARRVLDGDDAW